MPYQNSSRMFIRISSFVLMTSLYRRKMASSNVPQREKRPGCEESGDKIDEETVLQEPGGRRRAKILNIKVRKTTQKQKISELICEDTIREKVKRKYT